MVLPTLDDGPMRKPKSGTRKAGEQRRGTKPVAPETEVMMQFMSLTELGRGGIGGPSRHLWSVCLQRQTVRTRSACSAYQTTTISAPRVQDYSYCKPSLEKRLGQYVCNAGASVLFVAGGECLQKDASVLNEVSGRAGPCLLPSRLHLLIQVNEKKQEQDLQFGFNPAIVRACILFSCAGEEMQTYPYLGGCCCCCCRLHRTKARNGYGCRRENPIKAVAVLALFTGWYGAVQVNRAGKVRVSRKKSSGVSIFLART